MLKLEITYNNAPLFAAEGAAAVAHAFRVDTDALAAVPFADARLLASWLAEVAAHLGGTVEAEIASDKASETAHEQGRQVAVKIAQAEHVKRALREARQPV